MKPPVKSKYSSATPYIAAYLIFRKDGKIAFVLRQNTDWMNGHYSLPAGKVEWLESYTQAAIREAKEEVGVVIQAANLRPVLTVQRHGKDSDWVDEVFEVAKWQGELHNAEPESHAELVWFEPNKLPENIIPSTRFYIEQIAAGNHYAEYGWE